MLYTITEIVFCFSLPPSLPLSHALAAMTASEPASKRPRLDSDPLSIDNEIAVLNDIEQEEAMNSPPSPHDSPCSSKPTWKRPPPPKIIPSSDPLIFQQIDIDHYIGEVIHGMPGAQRGPVPILRMFGVTMEGNSVCANIHGFLPYFFVPAPLRFRDKHCAGFHEELNKAIMNDLRSNRDNLQEAVLSVDICQKCSMYGFNFNGKTDFLKITLALPKLVAPAKKLVNTIRVPHFAQDDNQVCIPYTYMDMNVPTSLPPSLMSLCTIYLNVHNLLCLLTLFCLLRYLRFRPSWIMLA